MDAIEYMKLKYDMCSYLGGCNGCPFLLAVWNECGSLQMRGATDKACTKIEKYESQKAIEIVKQWYKNMGNC